MRLSFEEMMKIIKIQDYQDIDKYYQDIINLGVEAKFKQFEEECNCNNGDIADVLSDQIEMLNLFKYRMELMTICCLSELWEQDLYNYLLKEGQVSKEEENIYCVIKQRFNSFKQNYKIDNYPKIKEMRDIANAIKHGPGGSYKNVLAAYGNNILLDSEIGYEDEEGRRHLYKQKEFDENILTSKALNVEGKAHEFYLEIDRFWKDVLFGNGN